MGILKPFVINLNDLSYLLTQVNFIPLFDAPENGNGITAFNPATMDAWDLYGNQVWNSSTLSGSYDGVVLNTANVALLGAGFPQVSSPIGIRDVSGYHNNLFGTQAGWGGVDLPFARQIEASYSNYVTAAGADYTTIVQPGGGVTQSDVTDAMPRIISRTITTGGVNLLKDGEGHFVAWDPARYGTDPAYKLLIDTSGVDIAKLVEGAKIVAPAGATLVWDPDLYNESLVYKTSVSAQAATLQTYAGGDGHIYGSAAGGPPVDGQQLYFKLFGNYVPATVSDASGSSPLLFDAELFIYRALVVSTGVTISGLATGDQIAVSAADIGEAVTALSAVGVVSSADVEALLTADSGYGLLEAMGHIDFQNPDSGEFFIGSENPGVAPVNSWFGIFGQFFDHGLDFIDKGGQGTTIHIALDPSDPLYRAPNGSDPGYTEIKVARATVSGADVNGDAAYVNHTSPFIDQSQTYGSHEQITSILREWVSTDGDVTFHAGMKLLDGDTLAETWTRRWPDGSTSEVNDTLPTLDELREHLIATGRDDLSWEDVSNLRNRDLETGDVLSNGGNSGHALLLDMNPHFDAAHILQSSVELAVRGVAGFEAATVTLNFAGGQLSSVTIDNEGTSDTVNLFKLPGPSSMGLIDVTNFSIVTETTSAAMQAATNEILLQSVGDHYIAGDGRVNENFGLTAIHHVFHEEHNYQVANLKTWIYAHDANNSPVSHDGLHQWQDAIVAQPGDTYDPGLVQIVDGHYEDGAGNYVFANGAVAWNDDKMFDATKLIVEMEYQHAAVDQYARTVTPRIQEFVGYSTGVDPTISLEYAQVAFRFGHSTIRETIDTLDPSGWYKGAVMRYALEKAFLAPQTFAEEGAAAITLGLTRQQMNEVDEFVTPALSQGLLGQPLDLAAINIARGRDLGIPTLNDFRSGVGLSEYISWSDFGASMIHPDSLANFIAAYSFGGDVDKAEYILGLANGDAPGASPFADPVSAADAIAFLNNSDGANAELNAGRLGFDQIDSWIGGLAEAHVPGGLLGETFDAVFVAQIQALMDGDRFYYLYRLFGTQIHEEINNGQFKDIVERNTGLTHLNGSIFAYADQYYDFNQGSDHAGHGYADLISSEGKGIFSDGGASISQNGTAITIEGTSYIRDVRPDLQPGLVHTVEGTPTGGADSHEVIVGTSFRDYIHARAGDDTVYGESGDDTIFGDGGVDRLYGGDGDDLIDTGEGPDLADGGAGKDTIYGRGSGSEVGGFDQLVGGSGGDLIVGGEGIDKLSGGSGDDIIFGDGLTNPEMGNTDPFTHGGDGSDYVDGGASGDLLYGEEGDDYIVGGNDQDIVQGDRGDDILRPGNPSQAINGGPDEVLGDDGYVNHGYDLIDFSDYTAAATGLVIDFSTQSNPLAAIDGTTPFPAWWQIEGVIASQNNDTIIGDSGGDATAVLSGGSNWLIGGSGSDILQGNGGNDVLVGGSIRLDSLIGRYEDAANASGPGNLKLGSAEWIADAMRSGSAGYDPLSVPDGYDNDAENSYTGASNRAVGALTGGLLAQEGFDLHFTEMLRARLFKDVVLGDGGVDSASDVAVFSGSINDYTAQRIDFLTAGEGIVTALKITDGVANRDGTDLVMGVESFRFGSGTYTREQVLNSAPVIQSDGGGATAAVSIAENTTFVTTVTASDLEGDPLTYSISGGADSARFTINAVTGVLSFVTAPNFELPSDAGANGIYDVTVRVTDGIRSDEQALSVAIQNVDEAATGTVDITGYAIGAAVTLTALNTISDPDGMVGFVQYQWQRLQGADWVDIAGQTGVSLTNQSNTTVRVTSTYSDAFGTHSFVSAKTAIITGTNTANNKSGTADSDYLLGLGGNDMLTGLGGDDIVDGGLGSDTLFASVNDGNDDYRGGAGTDTYNMSATSADAMVNLALGVASSTETGSDTLTGIENVVGSSGNNTITGNTVANVLRGLGGADTLIGGGGGDTLDGGVGADRLVGGAGGDIFIGGAGADRIDVGAPSDSFQDTVRYVSTDDFGDEVFDFSSLSAGAVARDRVQFTASLNSAFDDINNGSSVQFASGNGGGGAVNANLNSNFEGLYLSGAAGEGVSSANLTNASAVAAAFNAEFNITSSSSSGSDGHDALLVINDTNANNFSVWQYIESGGSEIQAGELTLIGHFHSNATVLANQFVFA